MWESTWGTEEFEFFFNPGELSESPEIFIQQMCSNIKKSSTMMFIVTDA